MRPGRLVAIPLAAALVVLAAPAPVSVAQETSDQTIIVTLDTAKGDTTQAAQDAVAATGANVTDATAISPRAVAVTVTDATAAQAKRVSAAVSNQTGVSAAQPSRAVHAASTAPNDPYYADEQWNLHGTYGIDAQDAWTTTTGTTTDGKSVVVGVVDTGITTHPDLTSNVIAGYDFISDTASAGDGDGRDGDPTDTGDYFDDGNPHDFVASSWHGTHVSGIIAAVKDNGKGIAGVAPTASIEPLRVLGRGSGSEDDIIAAISWGAGLAVEGMVTNPRPAAVLNLSLGGGGYSPNPGDYVCGTALQAAIDAAVAKGVAIVVAAGNSEPGIPLRYSFPANCDNVIRVTASDASGDLASYSDYGTSDTPATVAAPGSHIYSTLNEGNTTATDPVYDYMDGTSMATPHVSAVVALLKAANPGLSVAQIVALLTGTAKPLAASSGCNVTACGAGIVDAAAAVAAANSNPVVRISAGIPTISGTAKLGATVNATAVGVTPSTAEVSWQWLRNGTPIPGATSAGYTTVLADLGTALTVRVSVRHFDLTASATSAPVAAGRTFTSLAKPRISGKYKVGHKLKVKVGKVRPAATGKSYQWLRGGTAIAGATGSTYRLVKADKHLKISVKLTVSRSGYISRSATSALHKVK